MSFDIARLRPSLTRPFPEYQFVTLSLTALEWSAPHPAFTRSYGDEGHSPLAEARYVVLFSSRMALLAQVQWNEHFCLAFTRTAAGALRPARAVAYGQPAELLVVATVAADRFALVTRHKGVTSVRYWRERGEQSAPEVEEDAAVALPADALASGRVSCNAVVCGPFAHLHATNRLVALHRGGTYAAIVTSPWPSSAAWADREYAHVHVRRDGAALVEVREDGGLAALVSEVSLLRVVS